MGAIGDRVCASLPKTRALEPAEAPGYYVARFFARDVLVRVLHGDECRFSSRLLLFSSCFVADWRRVCAPLCGLSCPGVVGVLRCAAIARACAGMLVYLHCVFLCMPSR